MADQPVILITGASSGIGAATARLFGSTEYRIVLAARGQEKLNQLQDEINSGGGQALAVKTDITQWIDIDHLVKRALEYFGQIDILFNNAGIGRLGWLEQLDPLSDIQAQLHSNLLGAIWTAQAVLPYMIEHRRGHIINMASLAGLIATPTYCIYAASKFGVRGFTDALRREVHIYGIHVSAIYPVGVSTGFADDALARRKTGIRTPKSLLLSPDDVARVVLSLAHRPRRMAVIPRRANLSYWFSLIFPGIVDWATERFFVRPERF